MLKLNSVTIVYPESAGLQPLAEKLAAEIKGYRIPGSVRARTGIRRTEEIREPWLIVLCVPETREDPEVLREIRRFTKDGFYHHILTLLADGKPEESFPEPLLHEELPDGTVIDHEPLAANIAAGTAAESARRLKTEKLRLLAPMLGVSFDDLMNRRRKQRIRILTAAAAAVLAGGGVFLGITVHRALVFADQQKQLSAQLGIAEENRDLADEQKEDARRSLAAAVGDKAGEIRKTGDTDLAMLLCLEFLPEYADVPELAEPLREALRTRCAAGYVPVTAGELPAAPAEDKHKYSQDEILKKTGVYGVDYYTEEKGYLFAAMSGRGYLFRAEPLERVLTFANDATRAENNYGFDILEDPAGDQYLHHLGYIYRIQPPGLYWTVEKEYGDRIFTECSSDGCVLVRRGNTQVRVVDVLRKELRAAVDPPFFPVSSVRFAGELSENGARDSGMLLIDGILFRYRESETEVPETVEEQVALARELLNGRTLTPEERELYGLPGNLPDGP